MNRWHWLCWWLLVLPAYASAEAAEAPSPEAKGHYEAGMAAKKANDLAGAARELGEAVRLAPKWGDAHWALAWTHAGLDDKQRAIDEFTRVIALEPATERAKEAEAAIRRLGGEVKAPAELAGGEAEAEPATEAASPPRKPEGATMAAATGQAPEGGIAWHPSWEAALRAAAGSGRLIVASLYFPNVPACEEFDRATLTDPQVVAAMASFECVRLNGREELPWPEMETDAAAEEGETEAQVMEVPVLVFCRPAGSAFYQAFGTLKPDQLLHYIGEAQDAWRLEEEAPELERRVVDDPQDLEAALALARYYMMRSEADIGHMVGGILPFFGPSGGRPGEEGGAFFSFGAAAPAEDEPAAEQPSLAGGLWLDTESDEAKVAELLEKADLLLRRVQEGDRDGELGLAETTHLLRMQSAFRQARVEEATELAQSYAQTYPQAEGVTLAYLLLAMAAMERQEGVAPPDFSEVKALLTKAVEAPGGIAAKLIAEMFLLFVEMMDSLAEAFEQMGQQLQQ